MASHDVDGEVAHVRDEALRAGRRDTLEKRSVVRDDRDEHGGAATFGDAARVRRLREGTGSNVVRCRRRVAAAGDAHQVRSKRCHR